MKKKSPKVYKVKTGNTKSSSVHNVLSAVVMIAAAGLVGFVGYSIAKPFIQDDAATSDSSLQMNAAVTTQATEAATTAETPTAETKPETTAVLASAGSTLELKKTPETTATSVVWATTTGVSTDIQMAGTAFTHESTTQATATASGSDETTGTAANETQTTTTEAVKKEGVPLANFSDAKSAQWLDSSVLESADTFTAALEQVSGTKAVVVPMKLQGGWLNYASTVSYVAGTYICDGTMTASEIVNLAAEKGFSVYALISVTNDNQFPELYKDASIPLIDGSGRWLDNSVEKGGKPWMTPYSETTISYMTAIIQELDNAGFSAAICQDFVYPSFWESDRDFIDVDAYFGADRYKAMQDLADAMVNASNNMTVVLDMN